MITDDLNNPETFCNPIQLCNEAEESLVNYLGVPELWSNIEEFDLRERNNDSTNPILAKARSDARAEAQLKIFEANR